VRFAAITLCVASQRVFIIVVVVVVVGGGGGDLYDSVRKLLDTPSYVGVYVYPLTSQGVNRF
jgi:hypothetical protein